MFVDVAGPVMIVLQMSPRNVAAVPGLSSRDEQRDIAFVIAVIDDGVCSDYARRVEDDSVVALITHGQVVGVRILEQDRICGITNARRDIVRRARSCWPSGRLQQVRALGVLLE